MISKKLTGIMVILCMVLLPSAVSAQNDPQYIVVTKAHFDLTSNATPEEWKAHEKEYFEKVTLKNDLIVASNVLTHLYTVDNSEVLFVAVYRSWADIDKANDKNNELAKAAWPDSVKRSAFFKKQNSFYTSMHSDEIYSVVPFMKHPPLDTTPQIFYMRTSHLAFPEGGTLSEISNLRKEYFENVTQKNTLLKGYYSFRHSWGADSREFIEEYVYNSLADMESAVEANQALVKEHWPDKTNRKAFFDKQGKYFENWHGDALYSNVPALRKSSSATQ